MTLEKLLQKHFDLKSNLYLKNPKVVGSCCNELEYQKATDKGIKTYGQLIDILNDLKLLFNDNDECYYNIDLIINELDDILDGKED